MKATFFTNKYYLDNKAFDLTDKILNRDDCMYPNHLLRETFNKNGIDLSTQDINPPAESVFIIYSDMPKVDDIIPGKNNYLILFETEIIRPDNWDIKNHKYFRKIFTWHDEFVDKKKYFKINFSNRMPKDYAFDLDKKSKLCTLIAGHKLKAHPLELYTERIKAIRWFEQNHPDDFDLYGMGWDRYYFQGVFSRLNRYKFLTRLLNPHYSSYRGQILSKKEVLQKCKFAICYENAKEIPGWITEKVFDCFFAGCVPVYWGAPNVKDHIPADAFIDKKNFKTYEELYKYLKNMPDKEYQDYLNKIQIFLKSGKAYPYSAEYFAETIATEVMADIL